MNFIFFVIIILRRILSQIQCHSRCKTCTIEGDTFNHNCDICMDDTYKLENTNNCYYTYELPNYYYDNVNQILKRCQSPCYECSDENNCISCERGYFSEKCDKVCPIDEFIYILDEVEKCQGKESSVFSCDLKKTICSNITINDNFECPREYPIYVQNSHECVMEYNENNNILIKDKKSNKIIRKQQLNKIIKIGVENCWYINMAFSSNKDLIIESHIYNFSSIDYSRYFYGIKKNGRFIL